jgi:hypothetical protein
MASSALRSCRCAADGEIDHHDGVLLHHAEQHDDAHEGVQVELLMEDQQREQRAEDRRGQAGENRDGVNEALIQHAQHDIDHQDGHDQQDREVLEGASETPSRFPGSGGDGGGMRRSAMAWSTCSAAWPSE